MWRLRISITIKDWIQSFVTKQICTNYEIITEMFNKAVRIEDETIIKKNNN